MNKYIKSIKLRSRSGVSAVEMLLAAVIFVLLFSGITAASTTAEKYWRSNKAQMEVRRELQLAMKWISAELRQASNSSIISPPADNVPSSFIRFKIPTGVTGSVTQWSPDPILYILIASPDGLILQRQEGMAVKNLASYVQSLTFTRTTTDPNIVEVDMVAQKDTVYGKTVTESLDFSVKLRN